MAKRNYSLIAERQAIKHKLGKQNAIINAIKNGNINKAEIPSGKELISRDPVLEDLTKREDRITKHEETIRDNQIKQKLQERINKPDFDYNKFKNTFREAVEEEQYKYEILKEEGAVGGEEILFEQPPEHSELTDTASQFQEKLPAQTTMGRDKFNKEVKFLDMNFLTRERINELNKDDLMSCWIMLKQLLRNMFES